MSACPVSQDRLTALLLDCDPWRGPPLDPSARPEYKEWQHFVVFGEGWTFLFNPSTDGTARGKITTVLCGDDWQAHVTPCRAPDLRPGRMDATFDRSGARFVAGRYQIWHHAPDLRVEAELTPTSVPSLSHHIHLGPQAHLSWCLVPRLSATGWLEVTGSPRREFRARLAYHDHNWGRFRWGSDFSWEWGCAMPEDVESPWTVVFARMNDRARTRTTATSVFLLKDGAHLRYFRDREAHFRTEGLAPVLAPIPDNGPPSPADTASLSSAPSPPEQSAPRLPRVPAAAALLLPDSDRDVPAHTFFDARRAGDRLSGHITSRLRGQILVPSDTDLRRVVRLNEVHTRAEIEGHCAGEPISLRGPGLLEVVCG
ncbi:MAG: hypothetical protein R3B70_24565 [Polyangiaceae bacterium]